MIRDLKQDDLSAIRGIIDETKLFPSEMLHEMTQAYFRCEDSSSDEIWLVSEAAAPAQEEEGATGMINGVLFCAPEKMTRGTFNALLLAVSPLHQKRGVGRSLVAALEEKLRSAGHRLLLFETSSDSAYEGARAFYTKLGFKNEARIKEFYDKGEDKIVFTKLL